MGIMKRYFWMLGLALLVVVQSGCILQAYMASRSTPGQIAITPVAPGEGGSQAGGEVGVYPETPEGVVEAFLEASQHDPMGMVQYLSPAQQQALPPEGPLGLLQIDAPIEGFGIDSAAMNPDPPAAMVVVAIQAGGEQYTRTFYLIRQNNAWFVERIDSGG
jgi:hypothetical protein